MRQDDAAVARSAFVGGFRDDALRTAVAVAFAESDADWDAVNDTRGRTDLPPGTVPENSHGPWQINLEVWGQQFTPEVCHAEETAGWAAYRVFRQQGWTAWSTFNQGKHVEFMARAIEAIESAGLNAEIQAFTQLHTVQQGETLAGIAQQFLGSAERWPELVDINGITDPDHIEVGWVLKIPPLNSDETLPDVSFLDLSNVGQPEGHGPVVETPEETPAVVGQGPESVNPTEHDAPMEGGHGPVDALAGIATAVEDWAFDRAWDANQFIAELESVPATTYAARALPILYAVREQLTRIGGL